VGRTILVTRPRTQAGSFTSLLAARGARVVEVPTIELVPLDPGLLDAAIRRIHDYDWLIFTSVNGVEIFFRRLPAEVALPPICCIGPATSRRVLSKGRKVALEPRLYQAEGIIDALQQACGGRLEGLRFLLPRAKVARELLPSQLESLGATVDVIPVYETTAPPDARQRLRQVLEETPPDLVTFTSSSTVRNFFELAGDCLEMENLRCAVIGPITGDTVREYGGQVVCMPERATVPDLVEAIESYFRQVAGPANRG
jgi:uroporphyrinogen-III synthase